MYPPKLPDDVFRHKLAKFGIAEDMILAADHKHSGHYYQILDAGVEYIYHHYNTKEALRTLALGMVQAKRSKSGQDAPLASLARSALLDKNLLAEIGKMM